MMNRKYYSLTLCTVICIFYAGVYNIYATAMDQPGNSGCCSLDAGPEIKAPCDNQGNDKPAGGSFTGFRQGSVEEFLGEPFLLIEKLFDGRGGRNIITAQDGTLLAFHSNFVVESKDGGRTWSDERFIGEDVRGYNAILNEKNGEIMLVHTGGYIWKSPDNGITWSRESIEILPNSMMHGTPDGVPLVLWAMQPGVTLMFGEHKGRLIMASRIWRVADNPRIFPWWLFQYSNSLYSDDNGKTWQSSSPFPEIGTGEGAIAELSDGRLFYSSRKHYFDRRYPELFSHDLHYAFSYDGGENWEDLRVSQDLPDGPRHRSEEPVGMNFNGHFGLLGGLLRLPVEGHDILLYSNVDTPCHNRKKLTVWASFDGGETWPLKRLVYDGPAAYSSLGAGRTGTASEGMIYLMFEGGEKGPHSEVNLAVFNLRWLLGDHNINDFLK